VLVKKPLTVALAVLGAACATLAGSQTIVDEWAGVKAPPPPELKAVKVVPKETALLMLDLLNPSCTSRPRCMASLPKAKRLLEQARQSGTHVIHSYFPPRSASDFLPEVAPRAGEPIVRSTADKFINTELDKLLKERGVKTVIVIGTAAEGAVLNTGGHAAQLGYRVVLPVDGSSSTTTYAEQYSAWHLANAPTIGQQTTVTRSDLISF
jgi:nicotinamidase-related amidase